MRPLHQGEVIAGAVALDLGVRIRGERSATHAEAVVDDDARVAGTSVYTLMPTSDGLRAWGPAFRIDSLAKTRNEFTVFELIPRCGRT